MVTTNTHRNDPYRNFRFRVVWDGRPVASVDSAGPLAWEAAVLEVRDGAQPNVVRTLPGQRKFASLTLKRGITHDSEFEQWAGAGPSSTQRAEVQLQLLDASGAVVRSWKLHRCWVSRFEALADIEAEANTVAIESLTLQMEGWEREPA